MGHLSFRPKWYHIVILASIAALIWAWTPRSDPASGREGLASRTETKLKAVNVALGNLPLYIEIADTEAARERGLSGRAGMSDDNGMLFVFDEPDQYSFWMKDMGFDLDFIWLDENKTVVEITPEVSKDGYPEEYAPTEPVLYVLELNAGVAERENIQVGDVLNLP